MSTVSRPWSTSKAGPEPIVAPHTHPSHRREPAPAAPRGKIAGRDARVRLERLRHRAHTTYTYCIIARRTPRRVGEVVGKAAPGSTPPPSCHSHRARSAPRRRRADAGRRPTDVSARPARRGRRRHRGLSRPPTSTRVCQKIRFRVRRATTARPSFGCTSGTRRTAAAPSSSTRHFVESVSRTPDRDTSTTHTRITSLGSNPSPRRSVCRRSKAAARHRLATSASRRVTRVARGRRPRRERAALASRRYSVSCRPGLPPRHPREPGHSTYSIH